MRDGHTRRGRQTPKDREMDGQTETDTQGGEEKHQQTDRDRDDRERRTHMKGRKDTSRQTDGRTDLDTQEGQDRQQQTVRQTDKERRTHMLGRIDTGRQRTEGGRYDAPFKSFGQQGQLCQLCAFLAHDSLVQVVQQRVQLTDTDVTARTHAEGQVGEVDDHSALPGHWGGWGWGGEKRKRISTTLSVHSLSVCPGHWRKERKNKIKNEENKKRKKKKRTVRHYNSPSTACVSRPHAQQVAKRVWAFLS